MRKWLLRKIGDWQVYADYWIMERGPDCRDDRMWRHWLWARTWDWNEFLHRWEDRLRGQA